jgi:competence protein ComEC
MSTIQVAILNVGQGDTIIVYDRDMSEAIVVDCVEPIPVFNFFEKYKISHLRALILTHPHADHYQGAVSLLENCLARGIEWDAFVFRWDKDFQKQPEYLSDRDHHSDMYVSEDRKRGIWETLLGFVDDDQNSKKIKECTKLSKDTHLLQGIQFLHPEHKNIGRLFQTGSLNNLSYVIKIEDGSSILLTGDIEPAGWKFLKNNYPESLNNSVLKFPHHGVWRNADVALLLDEVKPEIVVISVGTDNTYGHPSPDVLHELGKRDNIRLLCTQATSNCSNILVKSRPSILALLREKGPSIDGINDNSSGCPCAGTVIIELGEKAKVIWPSFEFHSNSIINMYMPTHKCLKSDGLIKSQSIASL